MFLLSSSKYIFFGVKFSTILSQGPASEFPPTGARPAERDSAPVGYPSFLSPFIYSRKFTLFLVREVTLKIKRASVSCFISDSKIDCTLIEYIESVVNFCIVRRALLFRIFLNG